MSSDVNQNDINQISAQLENAPPAPPAQPAAEAAEQPESSKEETEQEKKNELLLQTISKVQNLSLKPKLLVLENINNVREDIGKQNDVEKIKKKIQYDLLYTEISAEIQKIVSNETDVVLTQKEKEEYKLDSTTGFLNEGKSISDYWQKVLENSKFFEINENDKKILQHLNSVKLITNDNSLDFKVVFVFSTNEFFDEGEITKSYYFEKDTENCTKSECSEISWKSNDKNPRFKAVKKNVGSKKNKKKVTVREKVASFFDFFEGEDDEEDSKDKSKEEDKENLLEEVDFLKNDLFNNQLEYYLGIMDVLRDDFEDEEDEEEEEKDNKKSKKKSYKKNKDDKAEKKEECKNQ